MRLGLKIWRQKNANTKGKLVYYEIDNVSEHMSFLEMMDVLNSELIDKGEEPVAFDHDCREGICVVCVRCTLMENHTVPTEELQLANFI